VVIYRDLSNSFDLDLQNYDLSRMAVAEICSSSYFEFDKDGYGQNDDTESMYYRGSCCFIAGMSGSSAV